VCSTVAGLWFLVAEHLRLGSWDMVKAYTGGHDASLAPRIGMQLVNESSLCSTRVRKKNYITHQGFELLNGLGFLVTDEQVHKTLSATTVSQAKDLQKELALIRANRGHFENGSIAIDPHRITSTTKRRMPEKKKHPHEPSRKMLQTFFALETGSQQPIGFGMGSSGANTTRATKDLLRMAEKSHPGALVLCDKEHFTKELAAYIENKTSFDFLMPAIASERIKKIEHSIDFKPLWAGYAIGETTFQFAGDKNTHRLIVQREGEVEHQYVYKSFLTSSDTPPVKLLSQEYDKRWNIEDFFNFDGAMGFDRASTFNQNIRYGKMSLSLLAQAANHQLRQKLPAPYDRWNATHLSEALLQKIDGDIRVKGDTIVVTCYGAPEEFNLNQHYENLPDKLIKEGIDPRIPWMYNFKLDFKFR
jgi:hypothetical protein